MRVDKLLDDIDNLRYRVVRLRDLGYIHEEFADSLMPNILSIHDKIERYLEGELHFGYEETSSNIFNQNGNSKALPDAIH